MDPQWLAGGFGEINGQGRAGVAQVDAISGALTPWNARVDVGAVRSVALTPSEVIIGGEFSSVQGQSRSSIALTARSNGDLLPWRPMLDNGPFTQPVVRSLAISGSDVYAAGEFSSAGGQSAGGLAIVDLSSGSTSPVGSGAAGGVASVGVQQGLLWVGGAFSTINGERRRHLAALDTRTGQLTPWDPDVPSTSDWVESGVISHLAVSGNTVWVAGEIELVAGTARRGLAAVDAATGAVRAADTSLATGTVNALAAANGSVFVAGTYTSIGGATRPGLAALDGTTGQVSPWMPDGFSGEATSLSALGADLYLAGAFEINAQGSSRRGLAALSTATGALHTWTPAGEYTAAIHVSAAADRVFVVANVSFGTELVALDRATATTLAFPTRVISATTPLSLSNGAGMLLLGHLAHLGPPSFSALSASDGSDLFLNGPQDGRGRVALATSSMIYAVGSFKSSMGVPSQGVAFLPR